MDVESEESESESEESKSTKKMFTEKLFGVIEEYVADDDIKIETLMQKAYCNQKLTGFKSLYNLLKPLILFTKVPIFLFRRKSPLSVPLHYDHDIPPPYRKFYYSDEDGNNKQYAFSYFVEVAAMVILTKFSDEQVITFHSLVSNKKKLLSLIKYIEINTHIDKLPRDTSDYFFSNFQYEQMINRISNTFTNLVTTYNFFDSDGFDEYSYVDDHIYDIIHIMKELVPLETYKQRRALSLVRAMV
eukprot:Pgem_evm2s6038